MKSITTVIINFLVGAAVAHGVVDQSNTDVVVNQITSLVGNVIILATAIYSLHNYVHKATAGPKTASVSAPAVGSAETVVVAPQAAV